MDVLTHAFLPFVLAVAVTDHLWRRARGGVPDVRADARREAHYAWAAAFGLAGLSPDMDGLYSALKVVDGLYWLQHRGFSHTLIGAPLHGFAALAIAHVVGTRWPRRFGVFRFRPAFLIAAVLGSWTHLLLDGVTYMGVPAMWPFAWGRWTLHLFHWLEIWMFPVVGLTLLLWWLRRIDRATMKTVGLVLVVLLIGIAGLRDLHRPVVGDDAVVVPRTAYDEWVVVEPAGQEGFWRASLYDAGEVVDHAIYRDEWPAESEARREAEWAYERVRETNDYRGFLMGSIGPRVVQVREVALEMQDETVRLGWNVTVVDVPQAFEVQQGHRWTPALPMHSWGKVSFEVTGDRITTTVRGW